MAKIVLADDHSLLRLGLAKLVQSLGYKVLFEADNGHHLIEQLDIANLPDIILLDINMPVMDGYETMRWIRLHHPGIKVLALSMYDNEMSIIRMLKCGARGYILKDTEPAELKIAIDSILLKGFYYSELISGKLIHAINTINDENSEVKTLIEMNEREAEFLRYACTELPYKEIADRMCVSPRTIDSYRDELFKKLNLKTRVGLVMYAVKCGIVRF